MELQEHSDAGEPPGSGHWDNVPMGSSGRNADIPEDMWGQLLDAGLDIKLERWRDVLSSWEMVGILGISSLGLSLQSW